MGRIDVHAHLLPSVDDGSTGIAESLDLARRMVAAGYTHLTCTPHVWPTLDNTTVTNALRTAELQNALDEAGINLTLHTGGEMHLSRQLAEAPVEDYVTYDNLGRHALFDFWTDVIPPYLKQTIDRMHRAGVQPILAHPERIEAIQRDPYVVEHAADLGLLLQCNLECVGEGQSSLRGRLAHKWLKEGRYFMLGSDLHRSNTLDRRLLGLKVAIDLLGQDEVDRLTIENPSTLIRL